jgi:hypothetical protein
VKEVTILDQELQAQLIRSLKGRVKAKTTRPVAKRTDVMQLLFESAEKEANIDVAFLDRAKEWKCMYRMELDDKHDFSVVNKQSAAAHTYFTCGGVRPPSSWT